ncbi:hypothetical protein DEU40_1455 [Chryseobacterium sp. AG844]|nr:hypothetical protein DEU40_1455 [Chryseobacterium sp. AG844]
MKKRNKLKIFLYIIFTFCFTNKMTAQILEFYKPIIISYKPKLPHESFRVVVFTISYIYQYRDHLGNARVSFAKSSEGGS